MASVPRPLLTPEEYLARERRADFKSEYYRGEMFAMAGASIAHTRIKDNMARKMGNQLEGGPCAVFTSDLRVKVSPTGLYTYPDVVVVCGDPQVEDQQNDTLLNPRVIVEVLSDSTEQYDRGKKFRHYREIESLQEYVLVAQDEPLFERYVRQADGSWTITTFADPKKTFEFSTIPVVLTFAEVYAGVKFRTEPDANS